MTGRLQDKRVLVTQADDYMGPITLEVFAEQGAEVIADTSDLSDPARAAALIEETGHIDVLVANLAAPANLGIAAAEMPEDIWQTMFDVMVHPLHRLTKAVLPQMVERQNGKILVYGSATGVKGMAGISAYSSARHAQVGYVRSTGAEIAAHNIQMNLIAQNFVENPVYFPPAFTETPEFKELLKGVPAGRLATAREDAMFAVFLASDESDFFVGQAIPFSGGWAQ
ncbi:MAG: SDR family oxidoreductase [PS1 clade bacterium]|uniref:SDR family oxidoreductase n=1 Tax=PS1 clade bacterium TaxID=2175152 RepID=A0A937L6P8_9PROT|nr:SDR family oxidoreductase [PS1 clade bacterium]